MFDYEFMRIAFAVGVMLGAAVPCIGVTVVFKRLSMTGDALSHVSLAGVAIGLIAGFNPLIVAMAACVVSSLIIEFIRKKFYKYSEISIAIVLSLGIGLAGLLSSFAPSNNFNSYLFGSIVAISKLELYMTAALFAIVISFIVLFYKDLLYIAYNERDAKISGVHVDAVNIAFTVLTAVTVALASKVIGALIVSSLMIVPVAAAMIVSGSYKSTLLWSIGVSMVSVIAGLVLSYYCGLKPGGTIVLISIAILFLCMLYKKISTKAGKRHKHTHICKTPLKGANNEGGTQR